MEYIKRFFQAPNESFFLFGPRGSGKSTWLKTHFNNALWIDLLDPENLRQYSAFPERLRNLIDANPKKKQVIVDEIQKVPELLSLIHALIEEKRGLQFILTGSSARKLKRTGVDLLAGRALLCKFYPFLAAELGSNFSLDNALNLGLLPLVLASSNPQKVINSYAALYLKEEVQAEGLVRQIGHFARFLEIISFSHASLLNPTNIARECHVNRSTVENYIQILKDMLLAYTLPVFTKRAARKLSSHPKFYFFDSGVFSSLRPKGPLDKPQEIQDAALEGIIAEHLRTWIDMQINPYELSFWRTRSGVEVDFVVYGEKGFWAIEVKNNRKISPNDLKGLQAFKKDYPECTPLFLYRGKERLKQNNILCLPCEEFLLNIKPNQPLWMN